MNSYLKNPEIKAFLIKLVIIHLVFTGLLFLFLEKQVSDINKRIINENTNIIGQILYKHPELENDIISTVTKPASPEEISQGKKVLKYYGYDEGMPAADQPVLKGLIPGFQLTVLFILIFYLLPLVLLAILEYRKLYIKIRVLSSASESVMEGNFNPVESPDEEGDLAILTSNFNSMSNRLKLSLEGLKKDKVFLKNIISDISHQLKTPLSSLSAINDILLQNRDLETKDSMDFLQKSRSQLDRMEWLIINLLKIARLEAGAVNFKIESFPVLNSVKRAVCSLIFKAQEKNIAISITGGEGVHMNGDEEWTAEALSNIIKNSIEHTGTDGKISVQITGTSIFTSIIIEDNGEGIDKKDLPRIFERFYKGSSSVMAESVGIGLSLSKLIIECQNGSIYAASEKGRGSRFTITFLNGTI